MNSAQKHALIAVAAVSLFAAGCAKKTAAVKPPAPAPAPTTTATAPRPTPAPPAKTASTQNTASTPTSRDPDAATRARINQLLAKIEDAYFNYNEATIRPDAQKALNTDSTELRDILKGYPDFKLRIEGYCDERGSAEYNIALGDKRAESAKDYLVQIGIPAPQLSVVSYGKEKQVCQEADEACWQRNRRIHIVALNNSSDE